MLNINAFQRNHVTCAKFWEQNSGLKQPPKMQGNVHGCWFPDRLSRRVLSNFCSVPSKLRRHRPTLTVAHMHFYMFCRQQRTKEGFTLQSKQRRKQITFLQARGKNQQKRENTLSIWERNSRKLKQVYLWNNWAKILFAFENVVILFCLDVENHAADQFLQNMDKKWLKCSPKCETRFQNTKPDFQTPCCLRNWQHAWKDSL